MPPKIVLDTNVLYSALRSRRGASFRLISLLGTGSFEVSVSVPLVLEYEEVLMRQRDDLRLTSDDVGALLDYICQVAKRSDVFYRWRPTLRDENDEMVLEVAVAGGCRHIVTYNKRDFAGVESFGISVLDPREFLLLIGALP